MRDVDFYYRLDLVKTELFDALENLMAEQNGPPLIRDAESWGKAYTEGARLLAYVNDWPMPIATGPEGKELHEFRNNPHEDGICLTCDRGLAWPHKAN